MGLPRVALIEQRFHTGNVIQNHRDVVHARLDSIAHSIGEINNLRVGITAGSRGIHRIDEVTKANVDWVKNRGGIPVILPAMGSHGGATETGQLQVLSDSGISPETMGCEFDADMKTSLLGSVNGVDVHWANSALRCDRIIAVNRIKLHTEMEGTPDSTVLGFQLNGNIRSGLGKILVIGLGKKTGAEHIHDHVFTDTGLCGAVIFGEKLLLERSATADRGVICAGLALIENGDDETVAIESVAVDPNDPASFINTEAALLAESERYFPRLPFEAIRLLWVGKIGKKFSGTGADTNITGRNPYQPGPEQAWLPGSPRVGSLIFSRLAENTHGNAHGVGVADMVTQALAAQIDHASTQVNSLTARAPRLCATPTAARNDLEAIETMIRLSRESSDCLRPTFVGIPSTLHLGTFLVSEEVLPHLSADRCSVLRGPGSIGFDAGGNLLWPEEWHAVESM